MRRLSKRDCDRQRETKREEGGERERIGDDKFEDQVETIAISNWLSNMR